MQATQSYGKNMKWVMLIFACLIFFAINGVIYTTFNVLLVTVATDLGWSDAQRGIVATAYPTGMIWFVFIAGIALDKFNFKRMMGSLMVITGVLVILRVFTQDATVFAALMFIYGAATAFLVPGVTKIIGLWFDQKQLAVANGILTSSSPLGQLCGNLFGVTWANMLGSWQTLFVITGIFAILIGVAFFIFTKNRRNVDAALSSDTVKSEKDLGVIKNLLSVIRMPQMWMYILANFAFLGVVYTLSYQLPVVMQADPTWGLAPGQPGQILAFNNFSSMIGYTLVPILIARIFRKNYERNYKVIAICAAALATTISIIGLSSYNAGTASVCMLISGLLYGACLPAPKVLMLKLPGVSGARAGTALGVYITLERVAQSLFVGVLGASIAANPATGGSTIVAILFLQYLSPVMIALAMVYEHFKNKKRKAAVQEAGTKA
ncbi:MAG: MFS transporter [Ruminococcaceae bacterium]|nr:MFS transporter [Oscillospiraceae bacterium]